MMDFVIYDETIEDAIERISNKKKLSNIDTVDYILRTGISTIFIREGLHNINNVNKKGKWENNSSLDTAIEMD